ncbi:MAG: GAF domain-containing sensor histidine kinase [Candidatus Latescibacteria bacterium]|jgi:two-component system, NarL family, sensor kinase|nr:GAF domain-containing sensor histidine kinase [Candidatus Latescibacterota bacterium]
MDQTEQLQQRNRELQILNTIAHALNQSVDLGQALDAALKNVAELLDLDTSWIWLIREDTGEHYLAASQNLPPVLRDQPIKMEGWCYCVDSYLKGDLKGAANVNVVACSRLKNLVDGTDGLQYHASIPLYAKDKKVGILNVASTAWRELSNEDLRLLNTIGDLLSISVERARLFGESVALGAVEERYRLARELHDTLGQGLAAVLLRLEALDALLEVDAPKEKMETTIQGAMALARDNLEDARRAVLDLRAVSLEGRSLGEALEVLGQSLEDQIGVTLKTKGNRPLSVRVEATIYRMVQEALNNVIQHAEAQQVQVGLTMTVDGVQLVIEDDGCGFDPDEVPENHYGLIGLNERVRLLHGSLTVESAPDQGTRLSFDIPLES